MSNQWLNGGAIALVILSVGLVELKNAKQDKGRPLLNVSYDPTRELYKEINSKFITKYEDETGDWVGVEQSHGGSSRQARSVLEGVAADVVTLALPSDIDYLAKRSLIAKDWKTRLPHNSQPYFSTIVFVVRKSNPKQIKDWPDLIKPEVSVITPDPKTSGNGKLSLLAAWGSVLYRGGTDDEALDFIRQLYLHVPVLGQGARNSSTTFALESTGDVHLTWENEALREVEESKGDLQIVYPSVSIRAEPSVTWVDSNVAKHHSEAAAKAYLTFLFTDSAQAVFAKDGYRPVNEVILKQHHFPEIALFPITFIAKDWEDAQAKFFGDNGLLILPKKL